MVKKTWTGLSVGALVLPLLMSGCGIFETETGEPEKVRLVLDQSDTPTLEISTSLNFLVSASSALTFEDFSVDTVSVPFDQVYDITRLLRFYVMVTNIEAEAVSFHMRVTIDGMKWYNEDKTLEPQETAQFVYRYQSPPIY